MREEPGFGRKARRCTEPGVLGLMLLLGACVSERAQPGFETRDSAGLSIAVSRAPAWEESQGWRVDSSPRLDLTRTGSGPEHEFYRVSDATRLGSGTIVVANTGTHEIRLYLSDGTFAGSAGREGGGPGEYWSIRDVEAFGGDSILVHSSPTRITVLSPELDYVRSFELPFPASHVRVFDRRFLLAVGLVQRPPSSLDRITISRTHLPILRMGLNGGVLDTLGHVAGHEIVWFPFERIVGDVLMFGRRPAFDAGGRRIVTGRAERLEVDVLDASGALERIARVPSYPLALSDEEIDREKAAWLSGDPPPEYRRMVENMPDRRVRPAYADLFLDESGGWWAAPHVGLAERGRPERWEVFDHQGRWLGPVDLPKDFEVLEIGSDYVLGVRTDEVGVEAVQVLGIDRP